MLVYFHYFKCMDSKTNRDWKPQLFIYLRPTRFYVLGFLENWCRSIVFRGNPLMVDQLYTRHSFRLRLRERRTCMRVDSVLLTHIVANVKYDFFLRRSK